MTRLALLVSLLALAACSAGASPSTLASLNCSNTSDPKNGGTTYLSCVQLWTATSARPVQVR